MQHLTDEALELLRKRYFWPGEDWTTMCRRVAKAIAKTPAEEEDFFILMHEGIFLPNTPCLVNAGRETNLSACFIVPIEDDLDNIFETLKSTAMIFKTGGGVGINWSNLRPENAPLRLGGVSSGSISFMKIFDTMIEQVKSGGVRRGAMMSLLAVDHPDIVKFIKCKDIDGQLSNMNISVLMTDKFMELKEKDAHIGHVCTFGGNEYYILKKNDEPVRKNTTLCLDFHATDVYTIGDVWSLICEHAWKNGEPGLIFIDEAKRKNGANTIGCNPCQPGFATVLTPKGIRTFDDIQIGSIIWSGKQWTKISNKVCTGQKEVYSYQTTTGLFVGTPNHQVIQNGERIQVQDAKTIDQCSGDSLVKSLEPTNPQDVMDGLVLGDGSRHKASGNLIVLYIGQDDQDYFKSEISELIGINYRVKDDLTYKVATTIHHSHLVATYVRQVPNQFLYGDRTKVRGFLRGMFSANGSVVRNRITLKSASFHLIQQIQVMLSGLGIRSYFTKNQPTNVEFSNGTYECKQSYDLNITSDRRLFLNQIGFLQKYKEEKLLIACETKESAPKKTSYEVISREKIRECDVYDITVEAPEHTYWTGGHLVSNCGEVIGEAWDACVLGSIDVSKMNGEYNFPLPDTKEKRHIGLLSVVQVAVGFLNNVIDKGKFPLEQITQQVQKSRKIGLGIMGFADHLINLKIKYGNDSSYEAAHYLMEAIQDIARSFSNFKEYHNDAVTVIAPTGSLSLIANCLAGQTLIHTTNGLFKIKDLVGQTPFLYCEKEEKPYIAQASRVWHVGKREVYRVVFDDDSELVATPEHKVRLSNGEYRAIQDLQFLDSVTVFYKWINTLGRYELGITGARRHYSEHIIAAKVKIGRDLRRKEIVHHIDGNPINNDFVNLQVLLHSDHAKLHGALQLVNWSVNNLGKTYEEIYGIEKAQELRQKQRGRVPWNKGRPFTKEERQHISDATRQAMQRPGVRKRYEEGMKRAGRLTNHKVIKVIQSYDFVDVYDIEVPETQNFIANRVVVHNCSSGIEPNYAWTVKHNRKDFGEKTIVHRLARPYLEEDENESNLPPYFVTALQVHPQEHVQMQACFQQNVELSISKTINLRNDAVVSDISSVYSLAWTTKCKGITVYRDGSREHQVLTDVARSCHLKRPTDDSPEARLVVERPYCLEGKTYKLKLQLGKEVQNVYINITTDNDGKPYEVFLFGNVRELEPGAAQAVDVVTRLISLCLRGGVPVDKVISQLDKVPCGNIYSLPHKIATVLREYTPKGTQGQLCPECGSDVIFVEKCIKCVACGWSKCN